MLRILGACLLSLLPAVAFAQAAPDAHVSVRITDSAAVALGGVDVSIVRDVSTVLAHATTNAAGRASVTVSRLPGSLQLIARRIGYQPGYRFCTLPAAGDSVMLELRLLPSAQQLAPVKVTAQEDLKQKSYYLTADDIENTSRTMLDATDLFKLRPDMMTSRGGAQACAVPWTDHDGWIENVWVNGRHIVRPVIDPEYLAAREGALGIGAPRPARPNPRLTPMPRARTAGPPPWTQYRHIDTVLSILRSIKPEHIAEVTYQDCFGGAVGKNHSEMAMFIVLKPGIGYDDGVGSYVIAEDSAKTHAPSLVVDSLARHRFRLLGAYDRSTGDPITGLAVTDTLSGLTARTTATGTVSLFFLPEGTRGVRLHRDGYRDTTITVTISPRDTLPLTLVLTRTP